jgi:hypothetical protein
MLFILEGNLFMSRKLRQFLGRNILRGALIASSILLFVVRAPAQQPLLGSNLPNPRLMSIMPIGGKAGTTVELTWTGTDLEEPQELRFSVPGIKAEPIKPATPAPDPTKPAPNPPPPPPPVTKFKVAIPADAPLGVCDIRLVNKWGVSNPRAFVVGDLPEVLEKEPNNDVDTAQRVEINTTINGAIAAPTDVDYFVFAGKKGQRVLMSCLASTIDSRLHAALELYNAKGKQLAFNRHYNGSDALIDCTLPDDGDHYVRLFEFTHTLGTPEHFYRLSITTGPWIDAIYPPMVEPGKPAKLTVYGRNLPDGKPDPAAKADDIVLEKINVTVDVPAAGSPPLSKLTFSGLVPPHSAALDGFEYRVKSAAGTSNPFLLTFAKAPIVLENDAHGTPETAQEVPLPCEIAGRIDKKRDRDWYSLTVKKGDIYNVEVLSDRIGAPTDMKMVLRNPATKSDIVELDDSAEPVNPRFFARSRDPGVYRFVAPADGKFLLMVTSLAADKEAGPREYYRIRITPDLPDYQLIIMPPDNFRPDSCCLMQGGSQNFTIFALRQDGFNGEIAVTVTGLPNGVTCPPQSLGAGQRQTELVLTAAADAAPFTGELKIIGTATIKGQKVEREARPASITWPVPPQQNIPTVSRLDRNVMLAVRDKAPYILAATIDKSAVQQGDKATITVKLTRVWPEVKGPMQVLAIDLPPNLTINNNQPATIAADKAEATLVVDAKAAALPGTYNLVLRSQTQFPYNKDPKAPQKPPVNVVLPANPVTLTVLPKNLATVAVTVPNANVKAGGEAEVVVKLTRLFDYTGEFKVELVLPPNLQGVSADAITIPMGKDEAKLILKAAADATPGARNDLVIRATAAISGVSTTQEAKFNVNVVK